MTERDSTAVFPAERTCPFDPAVEYTRRRETEPVSQVRLWNGEPVWLVTRHADVRALLRDPRFSADMSRPGFPIVRRQFQTGNGLRSFIRMDPPDHTYFRRMLTREFAVGRIDAMRPTITGIVDEYLDGMAATTRPGDMVDMVDAFALPVPSRVICGLLGVPYTDHAFFQRCTRTLLHQHSSLTEVRAARDELADYLRRLVVAKEAEPTDDVLGRLITDRERPGEVSQDEVVSMALLLLVAGHETTANMIGLSTLLLLEHPAELDRLRADPSLLPGTVEELLRYCSIVQFGLPRVAVDDVELGGRTIHAGEGVIALLSTANRDPAQFDDADRLDVGRAARRHVAFGFGVHQCLGQTLARVELQIALDRLFTRFPGLRLAVPAESVRLRHDMLIFGVHELPVTW